MSARSRLLIALAGLVLLLMFWMPLWRITLEAPQYPEGLGLRIMLSDVKGANEFDLQNINNLNHYIGMQRIEPDAIPELRIMPWVVGFLLVFALAVAATGNRTLLTIWISVFIVVAIAGLIDFWLWEYDYGHNLDLEHAAIKVPGMTYQPPLIGSKQLLNFKAHSWPGIGGWASFVSMGLGLLVWFTEFRANRRTRRARSGNGAALASSLVAVVLLSGCTPEPEPFHFGEDVGAYCRMTIDDNRFASQVVMQTGRVYKFDSIECLASWMDRSLEDETDVHSVWVTDMGRPGTLISALEARFVKHTGIRSPMGGGWAAFASDETARMTVMAPVSDSAASEPIGPVSWLEMRRLVHIH